MTATVYPSGMRSRFVNDINGLTMHVLEAGFEDPGRPCVLLLHGFPELAYSWRKVMLPIAAAGFHVVAPDQRGYGETSGWDPDYDGDLDSFRFLNLVRDALWLVARLGYRSVAAVVGHDFGSPVAACCALIRPDVFRRVVLMSAPCRWGLRALPPLRAPRASTTTWRRCRARANTISGTTRPAPPTRTCGTAPRGSTTSCAPIST
jgi:pimeloyl-ACP methyl ester carboxylesterase